MFKKAMSHFIIIILVLIPMAALADLGQVVTSKDIEITMMGALQTLPHFIANPDFNSKQTKYDMVGDEAGLMTDHAIRTEARVGWKAAAKDWDFLLILEADFLLNKVNVDRQTGFNNTNNANGAATVWNPNNVTANSDTFGIEKINFGYDFGPMKLNTGWDTKFVDLMTGGLIYADDHPYIGFAGKFGKKNTWELLYITVQDDVSNTGGVIDGDTLDWRMYTLRVGFNVNGFTLAPIYVFSDNSMREADVHYMGVEGYGPIGIFTPRFELAYAFGDKADKDISAWAAFASLEVAINKAFVPYAGGYYLTGDDDATDDDINAYNGTSTNSRYAPTFGMANAFIYRAVPALGSTLYENNFNLLGSTTGYGGISNSSKGDAPGLIMFGAGAKGAISEKLSYKTQAMYFMFEEDGALEKTAKKSISNDVGLELDLQLTYKFNSHFSIGNVVSVFFAGDSIQDRLGKDYDTTAVMDTIEMIWNF